MKNNKADSCDWCGRKTFPTRFIPKPSIKKVTSIIYDGKKRFICDDCKQCMYGI